MKFLFCVGFLLHFGAAFAQKVDTFYSYPAVSEIDGIDWITTPQAGKLSSLVERRDSGRVIRHLYVIQGLRDSFLVGKTYLDERIKRRYTVFPLGPGDKRLWLIEDSTLLAEQLLLDTGGGASLPAVMVKARKDRRRELDHLYATGVFAEPCLYSFETCNEPYGDIGSFLRSKCGRFQGGQSASDTPRDAMGHPMLFYLNEQNVPWWNLSGIDYRAIAYVKCLESDFVADDVDKLMNGMQRGFSWDIVKGSPLKLPSDKTPFIVVVYTYDYPGMRVKRKADRKNKKHS